VNELQNTVRNKVKTKMMNVRGGRWFTQTFTYLTFYNVILYKQQSYNHY